MGLIRDLVNELGAGAERRFEKQVARELDGMEGSRSSALVASFAKSFANSSFGRRLGAAVSAISLRR